MSRKALDPSTHARQTKGKTTSPRSDKWPDAHRALAYVRRNELGQQVRSEETIETVGKAIEQGWAVAESAAVAFKIIDAVNLLNEVVDKVPVSPLFPQDDDVLSPLDELGNRSYALAQQAAALRLEAKSLASAVADINAFLKDNRVILNNRRQCASEQQMIAVYVNRAEKRLGIELAKVEPKELETLVQLTGIHEGEDLADAPESIQTMSGRWKTLLKKVRRGFVLTLEKAAERKRVSRHSG